MKRAAVLVIAACSRREPLASCDDDLRGVYAAGGERWMVLDHGAALEAYPLFPDGAPPGPDGSAASSSAGSAVIGGPAPGGRAGSEPADLVVAPRVIDLQRGPATTAPGATGSATDPDAARPVPAGTLAGTLRRRYMQRAERCEAHVPVHLTRCTGDTLELVLADPSPPLAFSPCMWGRPNPSRVVRWRRE